jgi:tetratricopeptide (TPR) repeat protein
MSTYPGNVSLATAVKDRVVSTFEQTLVLHRQGRTEEVIAGCNLILQMDPLFDPARKLLEKVKNQGAGAPLDAGGAGGDPLAEAQQALAARDFERVIQITTEILTNDLMNDDARVLSDEARERIEAAPFVDQFVRKCQQHVANGNINAARTDLEKARALDSGHPGVAQIEAMIRGAESKAVPTAFDASSFVVDTPAPSPRGTSQASDFGFTFEEEKAPQPAAAPSFEGFSFGAAQPGTTESPFGGSFNFDAPVQQGSAAPGIDSRATAKPEGEYDFSTASIETSPDDQKKIDQYLHDGDAAFDSGDYQQAIDLWSRVFLIDVTNEAASERIERAKVKRREIEQRLEGVLAAGIAAFERNDFSTARAKFEEVLRGDPMNVQAQDYLERIDSTGAGQYAPPPPPKLDDGLETLPGISDDVLTPPPPTAKAAPRTSAAAPRAAAAPARRLPIGLIAAVAAVVLLAAGGWFVWSRMSGGADEAPQQAATASVLDRATRLGQQAKFDEAIAALQEVQPGDPNYDAAIAMIADLQQKKARAAAVVDGRPAAVYYDENLAAARTAFAQRDYARAKTAFDNAARVKPLPPDVSTAYETANRQVAKLASARALFAERRYADAITSLQTLRAQDPSDKSVQRMIIDAHFNIGAKALREEKLQDAVRAFDAVLAEDPNDELARRSRELAQRYEGKPRDLLYRIYVKYLPTRQPGA